MKVYTHIRRLLTILLICGFFLVSCATIPSEAPELSTELGNKISSIEEAHINLLHRFFDEKRAQVDQFLSNEWVPIFAEEIFASPSIAATWDELVRSNNKEDRLKFLVKLGPNLQAKINEKRSEFMKPLDDSEKEIERKLRSNYNDARSINNTITSFLASASKVEENRKRYLDALGISDKKMVEAIDDVDSAVSALLGQAKTAEEKTEKAKIYYEKLNDVIEKLKQ